MLHLRLPRLETDLSFFRVESIASSLALEVDFTTLRASIRDLQSASAKLDQDKDKAIHDLKRLIRKVIRKRFFKRKARKLVCKLKKVFGKKCVCPHKARLQEAHIPTIETNAGHKMKPRIGRYPAWVKEQREKNAHGRPHGHEHGKHRFPKKKLEKIIKRIRTANQKLVAFERGLIHEDGIKDREWYRHLATAPGKWLGEYSCPIVATNHRDSHSL